MGICRLKTCGFFHCCNVPVVFLVSCSFSTACWIFSFKLFNVSFLCRAVVTKIVFPIIKVDVNPKGWKLANRMKNLTYQATKLVGWYSLAFFKDVSFQVLFHVSLVTWDVVIFVSIILKTWLLTWKGIFWVKYSIKKSDDFLFVQWEEWELCEPSCNSGIVCRTDDTPNQFLFCESKASMT